MIGLNSESRDQTTSSWPHVLGPSKLLGGDQKHAHILAPGTAHAAGRQAGARLCASARGGAASRACDPAGGRGVWLPRVGIRPLA